MTLHRSHFSRSALAVLSLAVSAFCMNAQADVVYSSLASPLPPNLPSLSYQATSTSEFGDHVTLAAGGRGLQSITVTMSDWAKASTYNSTAAGYTQALTFNVYNYASTTVAGSLIATKSINAFIPWRPEATAGCGTGYLAGDGNCYNGKAFNVTFDFAGMGVVLPDNIVFGLAFNTQSYGANPTGVDGPGNSLNFALSSGATIGTDVNTDAVFWNTSFQGFLTTGTAGRFGQDQDRSANGWSGLVPAVQIVTAAVPEPSSVALLGIAAMGMMGLTRRRRRND